MLIVQSVTFSKTSVPISTAFLVSVQVTEVLAKWNDIKPKAWEDLKSKTWDQVKRKYV